MCHYSKISRCLLFCVLRVFRYFRHSCFWCRTLGNLLRQVPMAPSTARSPSPVPDTQVDAAVGPGPGRNLKVTISLIQRECLEHILTGCIATTFHICTCKCISLRYFKQSLFPEIFSLLVRWFICIYSICLHIAYVLTDCFLVLLPFKPLTCSHLKSKNHWKFCSESSVELRSKFAQRSDPAAKSPTQSAAKSTGQLSWSIALRRASSRGVRVGSWQLWSCFQMWNISDLTFNRFRYV